MAYSAQELNALTQRAMADPRVQQALSEWNTYHQRTGVWSGGHGISPYETNFYAALRAAGMPVNDLLVSPNPSTGQLEIKNHGLPGWSYPVIIGAATVGGLGAAGAFSGPASGAAAGGSGYIGHDVAATAAATGAGGVTLPAMGGAAGAGGGLLNGLGGSGADMPAWLKALVAGGVGAAGIVGSHQQAELPAEMRDIFNLQKQRMEAQNPLYASILQLAKQRMPTSVQGAQLPTGSGPSATTGQQQAIIDLANRRQP